MALCEKRSELSKIDKMISKLFLHHLKRRNSFTYWFQDELKLEKKKEFFVITDFSFGPFHLNTDAC